MKEIRKYYLEIDEETLIYVCVSSYIKGINPLDSSWDRIKIHLNNLSVEKLVKINHLSPGIHMVPGLFCV